MKTIRKVGSVAVAVLTLALLPSGARASESGYTSGGGGSTRTTPYATIVIDVVASESDVLRWAVDAENRGFPALLSASETLSLQATIARKAAPAVAEATREAVAALKDPVVPSQVQVVAAACKTYAVENGGLKCVDPKKSDTPQEQATQPEAATAAPAATPSAAIAVTAAPAPNRLPT